MPTQTQVTGPSQLAAPYLNNLYQNVGQIANRPYQQWQGPTVAGLSDIQNQALQGIQAQMGGSPMTQQAQGLLGGLMQGGGNPFMDQMIGDVTEQARRAYASATSGISDRFSNPNSFGNSRHAMMQDRANESFARGLGSALGNLQYNAYGQGLDRQMQAAQMAQGLQGQQFSQLMQGLQAGSVPQMLQQRVIDDARNEFREANKYPQEMATWLSNIYNGSQGSQTTTTTPDPNNLSQGLGGLALILSAFGGNRGNGFNFFGN